jgi:hypothetical protein
MESLKGVGGILFGIMMFSALIAVPILLIMGAAAISPIVLPFLNATGTILFICCIVVFCPLSLFRGTRFVAFWGFFVSSYIFGFTVWLYGLLVTYTLWGIFGVILGLVLAGIGVVPLGIIAALINGMWFVVGNLVFGLILTYGARVYATHLGNLTYRQN